MVSWQVQVRGTAQAPRGRAWWVAVLVAWLVLPVAALVAPAPARAATPPVGQEDVFWAVDWDNPGVPLQVSAIVRHVGQHCVVYVQSDRAVSDVAISDFATAFDESIYPTLTAVLGAEPNPGIDCDPKVHILVYAFTNPQYVGYFLPADINPAAGGVSNRRELISLDIVRLLYEPEQAAATAAHEFAHLISYYRDYMLDTASQPTREETWVEEGVSMYAEVLCGYGGQAVAELAGFATDPGKNLTAWGKTTADYGASLAFVAYAAERFGTEFLSWLVDEKADGRAGIEAALAAAGHPERFDDLFGDWLVANYLDGRAGSLPPFGYASLDIAVGAVELTDAFPLVGTVSAPNYACTYLEVPSGDLESTVRLVVDGQDGAPLGVALISWEPSAPGLVEVMPVPLAPGYNGGVVTSSPGFSRHALAAWGMGLEGEDVSLDFRYSLDVSPHTQQQFLDVGADHIFYPYIDSLRGKAVVSGAETPDGSGLWYFRPGDSLLRAQFAKMIVEGLGLHTEAIDNLADPTFSDVPRRDTGGDPLTYPFDYVEEAATLGIVSGPGDGTFRPWDSITRIQLVRMILRGASAAGQPLPRYTGSQPVFADVSPLNPLYGDVMTAWAAGIISGRPGSDGRMYFAPWDTANRGQVAKMLSLLLDTLNAAGL